MNEQDKYGTGDRDHNSRSWSEIYRQQKRNFNEYLRLRQELHAKGVLSPSEESRLEGLIDEMRSCFFLPEKHAFSVRLRSYYQAIYRKEFLSV